MILPDFLLSSRVNQCWDYSGIDSPDLCYDRRHFESYPHAIQYVYNSRGYRDQEWPDSIEQLQTAIWCVGDSFTVGLGCPREHTWPYLLQQATATRTINVSMDGASNFWIHRKALQLLEHIAPKAMIIHWSYLSRSELPDHALNDEQRRLRYSPDLLDTAKALHNLHQLIQDLESHKGTTKIIHSFVPDFAVDGTLHSRWQTFAGPDWPQCPHTPEEFDALPEFVIRELQNQYDYYEIFKTWWEICRQVDHVPEFTVIDRARDGWHYDLVTAQNFVGTVLKLLNRNI